VTAETEERIRELCRPDLAVWEAIVEGTFPGASIGPDSLD
jgi:hypothetical protein